MNVSDQLLTLYTEEVAETADRYVLEIPETEVELGSLEEGEVYKVAVIPDTDSNRDTVSTTTEQAPTAQRQPEPEEYDQPPVAEGDERVVAIESTGDEGDGVAKVDSGYVVIVPEASEGDTVRIELDTVRQNVGFADVVEYVD